MRRRRTNRGLTDSRIYVKGKRFYYFAPVPVVNPTSGKAAKWHSLCRVDEGEETARKIAEAIKAHNQVDPEQGDMPRQVASYIASVVAKRDSSRKRPADTPRRAMYDRLTQDIRREGKVISKAFSRFDVAQVLPVDVAEFLDQWEGRKMAEVYKTRLRQFFAWAIRKGLRHDNPTNDVTLEKPQKRTVLITDAQFHKVRDALLVGKYGRRTPSGEMVRCYVDLCYLIFQRTTEIRLLKKSAVDEKAGLIRFKPTKTEHSSGLSVAVKITPEIREVLDRAKRCYGVSSVYVIHRADGQPFVSSGLRSAWDRACERAEVEGVTLKDIRPMAITRARKLYAASQVKVAAAHTTEWMTEGYNRDPDAALSEVVMSLPPRTA